MTAFLLDTDHISLMSRGTREGHQIASRLRAVSASSVFVSIVSYEEQMRGWLAEIAAVRTVERQRPKYHELGRMLNFYCSTPILPFDEAAMSAYQSLWLRRLRIGTMDLKIAAVALANDAMLLTRNVRDFEQVPDLQIEDWTL